MSFDQVKDANKSLRLQVKHDLEKRKKAFSSTGLTMDYDLKPYTTLPAPEYAFGPGGAYQRHEYRVRPTAIGPVVQEEDLRMAQNKEGIIISPSKGAAARAKPSAPASAPPSHGAAGVAGADAASPEDAFHSWCYASYSKILDALSLADNAGIGLLTKSTVAKVLAKLGCPSSKDDVIAKLPGDAKIDYCNVLKGWRAAGVRISNRQHTASPPPLRLPRLAAAVTSATISFDQLPATRAELARLTAELQRERDAVQERATREAIARMRVDAVPTQAGRKALEDACVTYSPSKRAAQKALHCS